MISMLNAAVQYADCLHWSVFPVSRSKGPLTAHAFYDATTDADQIREWWTQHPDANIGVRCTQFIVVDFDPRNGSADWESDLPCSWLALTGGGGRHHYFQPVPELADIPLGPFEPGVDLKGNGKHYVLLPPSVTSGRYEWSRRPRNTELLPMPEWLVARIVEKKRPKPQPPPQRSFDLRPSDRVVRARAYADRCEPAISGQGGSSASFRVVNLVVRGFDLDERDAEEALADWNARCRPPWTPEELKRMVRRALEIGNITIGSLL